MAYAFIFDDDKGVRYVEIEDLEYITLQEYCCYFAEYFQKNMFLMKRKTESKYRPSCLIGVKWRSEENEIAVASLDIKNVCLN